LKERVIGPVYLCSSNFALFERALIAALGLIPSGLSTIRATMNKVRSEEPFGQRLIGIFTALSPDLHGKTMLRRLCLVKKPIKLLQNRI
jgi:hypothetical protein